MCSEVSGFQSSVTNYKRHESMKGGRTEDHKARESENRSGDFKAGGVQCR